MSPAPQHDPSPKGGRLVYAVLALSVLLVGAIIAALSHTLYRMLRERTIPGIPTESSGKPVGYVTEVIGVTRALHTDGRLDVLATNLPVFLHDELQTDHAGRLAVRLEDGTLLRLGEDSRIRLDEFIFSPHVRSLNTCSLRLVAGAMRLLTGAIAELNPSRFQVETRLATLGIRGCEVGAVLTPNLETFYIFQVPPLHRVVVSTKPRSVENGRLFHGQFLEIPRGGAVVTVSDAGRMQERGMTAADLSELDALTSLGSTPPFLTPGRLPSILEVDQSDVLKRHERTLSFDAISEPYEDLRWRIPEEPEEEPEEEGEPEGEQPAEPEDDTGLSIEGGADGPGPDDAFNVDGAVPGPIAPTTPVTPPVAAPGTGPGGAGPGGVPAPDQSPGGGF